ncbi:MAG TPA: hypothetical protein VEL74_04240 [Thermoanaerobaculia bacterium]|nr:hypothetical protein [Thermoanaerobaculia bacterium]
MLLAMALVVAVVLALALANRAAHSFGAGAFLPTGKAQWIWSGRMRHSQEPGAFYAVRDFAIDRAPDRARLLVMGDEEYVLYLNGRRVGSGGYRNGAGIDAYEVGPLLLPGGNRLMAELRSSGGAGGFLLSLGDETGRPIVVTDESWRVLDRDHPGLMRGWLPVGYEGLGPVGEPAFCWGVPPVGRWGSPEPGTARPLFAELAPAEIPGVRRLRPGGQDLPGGARVVYDWGREVTGYLSLELRPGDQLQTALLYTGDAPPRPGIDRPAGAVLLLPGRRQWLDATPRRFRYAMVIGIDEPLAARVHALAPDLTPEKVTRLLPKEGQSGVLGIEPPPLRTPVEDEVWRKLESVPGIAGRKDL